MDTTVPADEGAGVGKAGVDTPWQTGDLAKGSGWQAKSRGSSGPDAMNHNRKNSGGSGRPWDMPYSKDKSWDGTDQNQKY